VFIETKDDGGGGDNWTTGAISCAKLQSNHHHQQINIQFFTGRMPFLSPNQQCQSTEGKVFSKSLIKQKGFKPRLKADRESELFEAASSRCRKPEGNCLLINFIPCCHVHVQKQGADILNTYLV